MTKKLLIIIIILLILIFSIGGVCYADNTIYDFQYNQSNKNIASIQTANDNQTTNINNLYTNGYRSIISRYSQQTINVKIEFQRLQFEFDFNVSSVPNSTQVQQYINYLKNYFDNNLFENVGANVLQISNLNTDNVTYDLTGTYNANLGQFDTYLDLYGYISFDMPLTNMQLLDSGNASNLNFVSINKNLVPVKSIVGGITFYSKQVYVNRINYTIYYSLSNTLSNIDRAYFFSELQIWDNSNTAHDFNFNMSYRIQANNINYNLSSSTVLSRYSNLISFQDDSKLKTYSVQCTTTQGWVSSSYNRNTNGDLAIHFAIFSPFFANNNEYFIQTNTNGNFTPLKLQYYDAKWYEIHLQLANGFIFMITELPIISNITNVVYNLFNVINIAFNTLTQFSGFGYIFAFGMFALIFGLLIKMFLGD